MFGMDCLIHSQEEFDLIRLLVATDPFSPLMLWFRPSWKGDELFNGKQFYLRWLISALIVCC
jgi:hypothetical protein